MITCKELEEFLYMIIKKDLYSEVKIVDLKEFKNLLFLNKYGLVNFKYAYVKDGFKIYDFTVESKGTTFVQEYTLY
ncbi:hypothetical protein ACMGE9_00530 [Macrococcus sp. EM39E]|uniref:hypothetical protein n=1 Tax=Macrococcus animalis TaxID=3395467 RepID=UPI0039BDFB48